MHMESEFSESNIGTQPNSSLYLSIFINKTRGHNTLVKNVIFSKALQEWFYASGLWYDFRKGPKIYL